jgi:hypothetical protein
MKSPKDGQKEYYEKIKQVDHLNASVCGVRD